MGGSKQTQTTHAKSEPWAPAQPLLNNILGDATQLGDNTALFTPDYSAQTQDSIARLGQIASSANPAQAAFQNLATGTGQGFDTGNSALIATANGDYLNGNPYLDSVLTTARQRAADQINQQFSAAGRYGPNASNTGVLADRLGAIETQGRLENYNTERQNQLNAAGLLQNAGLRSGEFAGAADNANIQRANLGLTAGQLQDQMTNSIKQAPLNATQWQAGLGVPIAGLGGTQDSTTTSKQSSNIPGMIAGGLMTGLGIATGNPSMAFGGLGGMGGGGLIPMNGSSGYGTGQPFFGLGSLFGGGATTVPGTAANGGWSTTTIPYNG